MLFLVLVSSCGSSLITKRKHRSGYHVQLFDKKKDIETELFAESEESNPVKLYPLERQGHEKKSPIHDYDVTTSEKALSIEKKVVHYLKLKSTINRITNSISLSKGKVESGLSVKSRFLKNKRSTGKTKERSGFKTFLIYLLKISVFIIGFLAASFMAMGLVSVAPLIFGINWGPRKTAVAISIFVILVALLVKVIFFDWKIH